MSASIIVDDNVCGEELKIAENQASTNSDVANINTCTGDGTTVNRLDNEEKFFDASLFIIEE